MLKHVYGLDFGSYEIKVYDHNQDKIWREKDVIAVADQVNLFAAGDEAYEMYEKAPPNIQVIFPMKEGVISHFDYLQYLLQYLLKKDHLFARSGKYSIAVPTDVTEVEKRAFFDLVVHSSVKAKEVDIVERGIADAIGMGLNVEERKGIFVANFGGGMTELSVLSMGGLVVNKRVKIGGAQMDQAISNLVRHNQDFLIGRITAEALRKEVGVFGTGTETALDVAGLDLLMGVPAIRPVSVSLVRAALKEPLQECVEGIFSMLSRTPPEIRAMIQEDGIFLTGGVANMSGLSEYLSGATGLKVRRAKEPDLSTIRGLKTIMQSDHLKKLVCSLLDESYHRWVR